MSTASHEQTAADMEADFEVLTKKGDWAACDSFLAGIQEAGYSHEAFYLRKKLHEAQRIAAIMARPMVYTGNGEAYRDREDRLDNSR